MMTEGQTALSLGTTQPEEQGSVSDIRRIDSHRAALKILLATDEEIALHEEKLNAVEKASGGQSLWRQLENALKN